MTLRPVDAPELGARARDEILSAEALAFLGELHGRFDARRRELVAARRGPAGAGRASCPRPPTCGRPTGGSRRPGRTTPTGGWRSPARPTASSSSTR